MLFLVNPIELHGDISFQTETFNYEYDLRR